MEAEDLDQANASLLLNQKIDERIAEALMVLFAGSNTVAGNLPLYPPSGDQVIAALLEHPMVKTRIYAQAAETARMLILQAFKEFSAKAAVPVAPYYTTGTLGQFGYIYNADSMPKNPFF